MTIGLVRTPTATGTDAVLVRTGAGMPAITDAGTVTTGETIPAGRDGSRRSPASRSARG
jgi:hypothetical protein